MQTTEAETTVQPIIQKWGNGGAGRIQVGRFNKAWQTLSSEHNHFVELGGIVGGDEHSHSYYSPFGGGQRDDVLKVQAQIGAEFGWTLTADNAAKAVKAIEAALPALAASRPVIDKRQTPEAANQRAIEIDQARREREQKQRDQEDEAQRIAIELRAQYPWAIKDGGMSSHARAAANLKTELSNAFPGIAFSVRSDHSSVNVSWQNGPCEREVKEISGKYQGGYFDGMTDSYESNRSAHSDAVKQVLGQSKYVFLSRKVGDDEPTVTLLVKALCAFQAVEWPAGVDCWNVRLTDRELACQAVRQIMHSHSLPAGAVITGLERNPNDGGAGTWENFYRPTFTVPQNVTPAASNEPTTDSGAILVRYNKEHDGVEIAFPGKPAASVIAELKGAGFRWSPRSKVWYKRYGTYAWARAHTIAGFGTDATLPQDRDSRPGWRDGAGERGRGTGRDCA